ncbi:MAG: dTDP-4-dehydrorhamnose 3,5-epimerase family protein [Patescibacteria group bacterium]|nr:dTDP-4-dehydrorhamnose 3,5-epimerase family protein [Patescibacteria group bacterium]
MKLIPRAEEKAYVQSYKPRRKIDGVQIFDLKRFTADEGDFSEVMRFTPEGGFEIMPEFKVAQINRTTIFPGAVKAWHFHFNQDEFWYVPPSFQVFVGLWDIRAESPTANDWMRLQLGGGDSKMLYIPRGVAHGMANFSKQNIELFYFVNNKFSIEEPDERRIPWDAFLPDFWQPERD